MHLTSAYSVCGVETPRCVVPFLCKSLRKALCAVDVHA